MLSVPYSRYILYPVPWYSFLIVFGIFLAIMLACREERRLGMKKDTVIDLAILIIPCGIIGARVYYVAFTWDEFRNDFSSVFRIWEGGIAIYGAVIAGLIALYCFARKRRISPLLLCDLIAPGLVLAQAIGRWGNYFNMEAYGLPVLNPSLQFFPFAVQIPENGQPVWHMATFFYESLWDFLIFVFLMLFRRKKLRRSGDVFFFYVFLYAAGRFVIEDLRMDSLTASSVRASQLLSALLCLLLFIRYLYICRISEAVKKTVRIAVAGFSFACSALQVLYCFISSFPVHACFSGRILFLAGTSLLLTVSFFLIYTPFVKETPYADNKV